ncbi:MAG: LuxR C-terminal-related transcriptional regulator [Treponema sp.]|jgi:LuxR family maltose regulon positive regulatory protein|nr:LuxR C-terminal-related transcriptional regulator [Treponema sp.]
MNHQDKDAETGMDSGGSVPLQGQNRFFHSNIPLIKQNQFFLERPQLNKLLEQAIRLPLVTVVAGAGYGKTQTVYSFLRNSHCTTSWLQLSEWDNNEWRFWENFTMPFSFSNKKFSAQLTALGFPDTDERFARFCEFYRNQLSRETQYVVVFDDLHLIHNQAVLRFMERTIDAYAGSSYKNISTILISRTEPALNTDKLLSRGLLTQITEEDLRFSREETNAYLKKQHIILPPASQSDLYRDTEGWAFAIHLVGLSLQKGSAAIDYGRSSLRLNIFKLIEEELFSLLPEETQKYLIKLSLINHLDPEMLRDIAAGKNLIEQTELTGSFIHFDTYLNVYRIHHLFLEYLSKKQDQLTEEEKREVFAKAGRWCADHNMKMDAINYYEKAADYANIVAIIYTLPMILPNQIARYVLQLLDRAPQEVYDQNPLVYMLRSRILVSLAMFKEAVEELGEIIPQFEALPPSPINHRVLMCCYSNLGFIKLITSTYTEDLSFSGYFEKAASHGRLSGYVAKPPISVLALGSYICRIQNPEKGGPERYIEAITAMVPHAAAAMGGCAWGMDDLARAELAYFKGDLPGAETFARRALDKARERDQYEIENRALFYLLRIKLALGDDKTIQDILKQLKAQLAQEHYLNRFTYYDIVLGWYYTQIGQTEQLASWLKNNFEASDLNTLAHGLELIVKVKYHLSEKRHPAALAFLENREDTYDAGAFLLGKIELLVLEAVCRYQDRDREGALGVLQRAYELARPNALYMPFIELGKAMRALTESARKTENAGIPPAWLNRVHRLASAYAHKVFVAAEQYRNARKSASKAGTALSRRETLILTGLSRGLTREEIALDGGISVNTVKSAIRSIYNKLGAVNRADAIRIASARGFLNE